MCIRDSSQAQVVVGPEPGARDDAEPAAVLVPVSATTADGLRDSVVELRDWLEAAAHDGRAPRLDDLSFVTQAGREHQRHRLAFVTTSLTDLVAALTTASHSPDRPGPDGVHGVAPVAPDRDRTVDLPPADDDPRRARATLLEVARASVSYTHLTLPTKRIV